MDAAKYLVSSLTRLRAMGKELAAVVAQGSSRTTAVVDLNECRSVRLDLLGELVVKDLAFDGERLYVLAQEGFEYVLITVEYKSLLSGKGEAERLSLLLSDPELEPVSFDYGPYSGLCFVESCVVGVMEDNSVTLPVTEVARGRFVGNLFAVATVDEVFFFSVDLEVMGFEVIARAELPFLMTKEVWSVPGGVVVSPNDFNKSAVVYKNGEVEVLDFYVTGVYVSDEAVYLSGYKSDMKFVVSAWGLGIRAEREFEPPGNPADLPLLYIGNEKVVTLGGKCAEI